jgi:hypothetical protein
LKSKTTRSKKSVKKVIKLKRASRVSREKTTAKLPSSTFDSWLARQVKIRNRQSELRVAPSILENTVMPKDSYETWLDRQKPIENIPETKETKVVPDTFELWMSSQVARRSSTEVTEASATSQTSN